MGSTTLEYLRVVYLSANGTNGGGGGGGLQSACEKGDLETVKSLVDAGACVFEKGRNGLTPLHGAAICGSTAVMEALLPKYDGDLTALKADGGSTVLHTAASCGKQDVVKLLLAKAPGLLEARMEDGAHALHCAADGGFEEIVRELLTFNGQDYLASPPKDEALNTPLHLAASMGHLEVVNVICELVPDKLATLKMQNDVGETPLMCASSRGHEKVVNLIVQQKEIGELLKQQDASGCNSADKARAGGRASVLRILKDAEEETK